MLSVDKEIEFSEKIKIKKITLDTSIFNIKGILTVDFN